MKAAATRIVAPVVDNESNTRRQAVGQLLTRVGIDRYKLTTDILDFEKGTISIKAQQIMTQEIFDVDVSQSIRQKARRIGTLALIVIRPTGKERILREEVPDFRNGVSQINAAAPAPREVIRIRGATRTIKYSGGMPYGTFLAQAPVTAIPVPAAAATPDLNAENTLGRTLPGLVVR